MNPRRVLLAAALATTLAAATPGLGASSTLADATVLGETVGGPFGAATPCGGSLTGLQYTTGGEPSYQTTAPGVVTSFSYQADSHVGSVRALLFTRTTNNSFQLVGKSEARAVTADSLSTFPTRIPVPAGALLGSRVNFPDMRCRIGARSSGDEIKFGTFDPDSSSTFTTTGSLAARWNISAVVEPDADGDGYGDATQDLCPTSAATQAACSTPPPTTAGATPDTLVTKAPKKRSSKRKARVVFASTVPGATFTCRVDQKPAKPCSSPFRKRYKYGKHTVVITATAAGVPDPAPAVVRFKVKRPKPQVSSPRT